MVFWEGSIKVERITSPVFIFVEKELVRLSFLRMLHRRLSGARGGIKRVYWSREGKGHDRG